MPIRPLDVHVARGFVNSMSSILHAFCSLAWQLESYKTASREG